MSKAKKTNNLLKLLQEKIDTNEFFSFELNSRDFDFFPFESSRNDNLIKTYSNIINKCVEEYILVSDDFKNEVIDVYLNEYKTIKKFLEKNKISLIYEDQLSSNVKTLVDRKLNSIGFLGLSLSTLSSLIIKSLESYIFKPHKITFTNDLEFYKLLNYWFKKICGRI